MTRILTWNLERKRIASDKGKAGIDYLFGQSPDIMAISETHIDFPLRGGHTIWAGPPFGRFAETERKILIWSKNPWRDVDDVGFSSFPEGRFISGLTDTNDGPIRIVGVCIPWHMADVKYGHKNRTPWEQHKCFLVELPEILRNYEEPVIVAGDFNQRIPLAKYGNKAAANKLEETFSDFKIVTRNIPIGCTKQGLDHIALGKGLVSSKVWGWPNIIEGETLTDHDGSGCDIRVL